MKIRSGTVSALLLTLIALGGLVLLSRPPAPPRQDDQLLLPRAGFLRALLPGNALLAADYYWLRTINQVGAARDAAGHRNIHALADLTTDLDPDFRQVYAFAGAMIPLHLGRNEYVNTEESTALLEKGRRAFPDDYRIAFQLGYNLVFFEKDYVRAAKHYEALAKHPQAPAWLGSFATRLYAASGDLRTSLALTLAMLEDADSPEAQAQYEQRILEIRQEQALREIDDAARRYREREGAAPETPEALVAAGELTALPEDPLGGRFYFAPDGRTYSTESAHRLEVLLDDEERAERVRRTLELKQ